MRYDYPDYYKEFHCVGGNACSDSCCIVWQVSVDKETRKKYRKVGGELGKRMREKIDPRTGKITPHGKEKRCEFLNDDNLCDIITQLGEEYLCQTCATHPRHEEVYENMRERSLSITCPIVCKELLERQEKVTFLSEVEEDVKPERDRYFDRKLFEILLRARDCTLQISQNREQTIMRRMVLILGMAHDLERRMIIRSARQKRKLSAKLFPVFPEFTEDEEEQIQQILSLYGEPDAYEHLKLHREEQAAHEKIFLQTSEKTVMERITDMLFALTTMEVLKPAWVPYLESVFNIRSEMTQEEYCSDKAEYQESEDEVKLEQLLVYFCYVYLCTSVYDDRLLAKVKMAVVNTLLIRELWFMRWLENNKKISPDEQVEIAHWYVREIENSDENMEQWDSLMQRNPRFSLQNLFDVLKEA